MRSDGALCHCPHMSLISLIEQSLYNLKYLIICGCTALFVSDLVRNSEYEFSRDAAHLMYFFFDHCIRVRFTGKVIHVKGKILFSSEQEKLYSSVTFTPRSFHVTGRPDHSVGSAFGSD